jgi:hypothetical protein
MHVLYPSIVLTAIALAAAAAWAEEPGKVDLEAAEMVSRLLGAPVFTKDGAEVGRVADIAFDAELRPKTLRMTTGVHMGLGARTLALPRGAFMPLEDAVVLDVRAEAVATFAELAEPIEEK